MNLATAEQSLLEQVKWRLTNGTHIVALLADDLPDVAMRVIRLVLAMKAGGGRAITLQIKLFGSFEDAYEWSSRARAGFELAAWTPAINSNDEPIVH